MIITLNYHFCCQVKGGAYMQAASQIAPYSLYRLWSKVANYIGDGCQLGLSPKLSNGTGWIWSLVLHCHWIIFLSWSLFWTPAVAPHWACNCTLVATSSLHALHNTICSVSTLESTNHIRKQNRFSLFPSLSLSLSLSSGSDFKVPQAATYYGNTRERYFSFKNCMRVSNRIRMLES